MTYVYYGNELYHHGIIGQKWGVRRYQNKDGTLTSAGRNRYKESFVPTEKTTVSGAVRSDGVSSNPKISNPAVKSESSSSSRANKKTVAATAIAAASVAAAAVYVHNNPEAIGNVVSKVKSVSVSNLTQQAVDKGKEYVSNAVTGVKEGISEGMKEAPKKAAKTVVTGVVLNTAKKALDAAVGSEESAKIFQANDNKKIGKFWKVSDEDKDSD